MFTLYNILDIYIGLLIHYCEVRGNHFVGDYLHNHTLVGFVFIYKVLCSFSDNYYYTTITIKLNFKISKLIQIEMNVLISASIKNEW